MKELGENTGGLQKVEHVLADQFLVRIVFGANVAVDFHVVMSTENG